MNDVVNVWVFLEDLVERCLICDIALVKGWPLAANELNAVYDFWRGVVEIVDDYDLVICLEKREGREGANVAGTTASLSVLVGHDNNLWIHGGVEG